jgi:hypothetical protein
LAPNLDIVAQDYRADLGHLVENAVVGHKPEPVGPEDDASMHYATRAHDDIFPDDDIRVEHRVGADAGSRADVHARVHHRAVADLGSVAHVYVRAEGDALAQRASGSTTADGCTPGATACAETGRNAGSRV